VVLLAVEGTLLFELAEIFSPDRVQQLHKNPEEIWLLQALANEPEEAVQRRELLTKKQKRLQDALDTFRERLGDSAFNIMKMKLTNSSHQTPPPRVEIDRGLLPNAEHEMSQRAERRPSISVSRRSSATSNVSAMSAFSENTTLTVPSQAGSPMKGSGGPRSRSKSGSVPKVPLSTLRSDTDVLQNEEY
jgi:hypothetical protein